MPRYENHDIGNFGHIAVRPAGTAMHGFIVGVPHGTTESGAVAYAETVSDATGAALVVAYGFNAKHIAVAQPLIHTGLSSWGPSDTGRPASIYPEFKRFLQSTSNGPLEFYVEFRIAGEFPSSQIEVASAGFSFEELEELKNDYVAIENAFFGNTKQPRVEIAVNPLDPISWDAFAIRNHGVLMLAKKGLVLRLPKILTRPSTSPVYREIVNQWVLHAYALSQRSSFGSSGIELKQMRYGDIELIPARSQSRGIVIGAPHGSFDWFTGDMVEELSYRTSLASVVARGFTPTECNGWRIDVNRPTERRYPTDTIERTTERAVDVYQEFKKAVLAASRGSLQLYIDIHQNSTEDDIMVATLGITREQAQKIKNVFREIRNRVIPAGSPVKRVNLLIEPVDQVTIGAWAAKEHGILRLAKRSLHFEMPAQHVFYRADARHAYTKILAELIHSITLINSRLGSGT